MYCGSIFGLLHKKIINDVMIKKTLIPSMNAYLTKGERKIDKWFSQHPIAIADLSHFPKSFENFNSQEEIIVSENNND